MVLLGCVHLRRGLIFQLLALPFPFAAGQELFAAVLPRAADFLGALQE